MSVCDIPLVQDVCGSASQGAASLAEAPLDLLARAMGGAASWLFQAVWGAFDSTTTVDLTDPGYLRVYDILFGVAVFVMLIFFCLQLITGLAHRDPTALGRAALGLAKSVFGSFLAIALIGLLLDVTDQLSVGIVQATGNTMTGIGKRLEVLAGGFTGISLAAPGAGALLTIFLAGLAVAAAFMVWFSLLIRKVLLLVAIVFAPVAMAGASWDATRGWVAKWAAAVVALAASKLVLVVIFLVAITQVAAPINADLTSVSQPVAGVALMVIAAFAPYLSYRFLHFAGVDMYHAMGAEQEAKQALNRPVPLPSRPAGSPKAVLDAPEKDAGAETATTPAAGQAASDVVPATMAEGAAIPVAGAAVVGAEAAKSAATAGPQAGTQAGRAAEEQAVAADNPGDSPAATPPAAPSRPDPPARPSPPSRPEPPTRPQPPDPPAPAVKE